MTSVTDRRVWTVDECLLRLGSLPSRASKLSMSGEFDTRQRSPHNPSEAGRSVTTRALCLKSLQIKGHVGHRRGAVIDPLMLCHA